MPGAGAVHRIKSEKADPPLPGKARRGRVGGPVGQPHRPTRRGDRDLNRQWYERNTGNVIKDIQRRGGLRGQVHSAVVVLGGVRRRTTYFRGFFWVRSRSLTPGPPPFSSMNSTPAFSRTRLMFESVSGSPAYRPTSRLVTVLRCKPVASARSRTVQFNAARAIRTCALVTVIKLCHCHMWQRHMLIMKE